MRSFDDSRASVSLIFDTAELAKALELSLSKQESRDAITLSNAKLVVSCTSSNYSETKTNDLATIGSTVPVTFENILIGSTVTIEAKLIISENNIDSVLYTGSATATIRTEENSVELAMIEVEQEDVLNSDEVASYIAGLEAGEYSITVKGTLTEEQITAIKSAINADSTY